MISWEKNFFLIRVQFLTNLAKDHFLGITHWGKSSSFVQKKVKLSFFALKKLDPSKSKNSCNAHIAIKIKLLVLEIEKLFCKLDVLKISD